MTQQQIFKILTKNCNFDYELDYPCLQKNSISSISKNLTTIIYESLKQKSISSNTKRANVLKFLNGICEIKESHINILENYQYKEVLENCIKTQDQDVRSLLHQVNSELKLCDSDNIIEKVSTCYKRKSSNNARRNKILDFIKQKEKEKLDLKLIHQPLKYTSHYEVNETHIKDILGSNDCKRIHEDNEILDGMEYREKQIKLVYSLLNLNKTEDVSIIERILQRLTKYDSLEVFEVNFLIYLWSCDSVPSKYHEIFQDHFFFVLERVIMKLATKLLQCNSEHDICEFFTDLEKDQNILKIRILCNRNKLIYFQLKNLIFELYIFSFCNNNILRLSDMIIE